MRPFTPYIFSWYVYRCSCRRDQKKIEVFPAWIHKLTRLQQWENCKIWKIPYLAGGQHLENSNSNSKLKSSNSCRKDLENSRSCCKIWKIQDLAGKIWKVQILAGKIWKILDLAAKFGKFKILPARFGKFKFLPARFGKFKILQLIRVNSPPLTHHY